MNTDLKRTYREASDFFTYVKLYAPEFPPADAMSPEKAMSRMFDYLESIETAEQNPSAKQWLRVSHEELKRGARHFAEKQDSDARKAVGSARDYLNNAAQRKSVKPGFLGMEPGFADNGTGRVNIVSPTVLHRP
jgi:hypothetical protein